MNKLSIKLVWRGEKMTPTIEELNGLPISPQIQMVLNDFPPFYDELILQGDEINGKFIIEHIYTLNSGNRQELKRSEFNELLYEAGYPWITR